MALGLLIIALVIILLGAEVFTNALEHLGERLKISEGVTGSLFAAVATALPEAMVPVIAILTGSAHAELSAQVGVGAILGAPMMLSSLTLFLMAGFAAHRRGWGGILKPEHSGIYRDLFWFLLAFSLACTAAFMPHTKLVRGLFVAILILLYIGYLIVTLRASKKLVTQGHGTEADHPLFLSRLRLPTTIPVVVVQLALGFAFIAMGTKGFVHGIESLSDSLGMSPLVLSLLIIPVATELPEKINSILWIRRARDTLAFGNITGAMVFQGTLLPALGIGLTPWEPRREVLVGMALTLLASGYVFTLVARRITLRPYYFIVNGACYVAYFLFLI